MSMIPSGRGHSVRRKKVARSLVDRRKNWDRLHQLANKENHVRPSQSNSCNEDVLLLPQQALQEFPHLLPHTFAHKPVLTGEYYYVLVYYPNTTLL